MKPSAHAWIAVGMLGVLSAIAADPPNVEERLKKLEGIVEGLQQENLQLKKELGYDPKVPFTVLKPAGKAAKVSVGGFLQAQAEFGKAPDARFNGIEDRFLLRRARINIQGSFLEHFDFKLEGDFGAGTLSETAASRAQLTDLFVNWNRFDFANVKLGQYKTPYGFDQLQSDTKLLTIERSLPSDRITDSRQIGIGLNGAALEKRVGYSVGLFNGSSVNNSYNDNNQFMYAGRLHGIALKTKWGEHEVQWSFGLNGLTTHDNGTNGPATFTKVGYGFDATPLTAAADNVFKGDRWAWGLDTQFTLGRFGLYAEYLHAYFEPTDNLPSNSLHAEGWYVMSTYYILPKKLQAVVRYETFDPDTSISGNSTDVWTLGLTYYIKGDDLKFMVNYLLGDRAAAPGFPAKDDQGRLLARFQVMF